MPPQISLGVGVVALHWARHSFWVQPVGAGSSRCFVGIPAIGLRLLPASCLWLRVGFMAGVGAGAVEAQVGWQASAGAVCESRGQW